MSKWATNDQDVEDYEQEKIIEEWLDKSGNGKIDLKYITSKGTARNTLIKASISLDQEIRDGEGGGTFADLIIGCDGRDLYSGEVYDEPRESPQERIYGYLLALKLNGELSKWVQRVLRLSMTDKKTHYQKFQIDLEW